MGNRLNDFMNRIGGERDLALALSVVAIIAMLILPMPPFLRHRADPVDQLCGDDPHDVAVH